MTKNSKKTESENSENDTDSFDIIKTGLATYWEKRQTKKQQQKQSEAANQLIRG